MNIIERAKAPTPKFFRVLRSIGMALLAISGSIIAAPVVLPVAVVSIAGYAALAGGVISVISQITVDDTANREQVIVNRLKKDNQNLPRDGIK
ncbi:uncharacterized membrane protein HdeD (DUF308 family) [Flavobacterium sp. CG_23.5]|uniref:hypothetical protein n=1 Tax=Flavobacterium sp. CG_23.5 TaxID=2760708 RepID=UPI001AE855AE|nr:hypothetical protein [Flavobacterium sp. CG_23.5]MBP2284784.1 uncharacterized membrane protein HdeD (DUF308 family) [Flavobacterium sp. CG_23.5]